MSANLASGTRRAGGAGLVMRAAVLGLFGAVGAFAGNIGIFDFTELPGEGFSADAVLFNTTLTVYPYFPRQEGQPPAGRGWSNWITGISDTLIGGGGGPCTDGLGGPCYSTKAIIFQEPDDPSLYNVFEMGPDGWTDSTSFRWYSDVSDPWSLTWGDCTDPITYNYVVCAGVADGSTVELPTWGSRLGSGTTDLGTITIRFSDKASAAASPEPASMLLIAAGLAFIRLAFIGLKMHSGRPRGPSRPGRYCGKANVNIDSPAIAVTYCRPFTE